MMIVPAPFWASSDGGDPYWDNVSLLVQGGTNGGLTVNDLSAYASSVTISANASFTNAQQVLGSNTIRITSIAPNIPQFVGDETRFSRPSGEAATVEVFFRYNVLENFSSAGPLWYWFKSGDVDRLAQLYVENYLGVPHLHMRQGGTTVRYSSLSANTTYFIQLTVSADTYYLDVGDMAGDGTTTQVGTGSFIAAPSAGTYNVWVASIPVPSASGSSNAAWITPLRWTKGVARARGSIPSAAFPTY